ncbi:DUF7373 family lipoprotein [Nocardia concava]|uniref:DUF7373 family lipoprotein n=1 Tax=Nocardia concava TaxID=257281 RepID=UPI0002E20CE8|nr:hypothetical protein [Nocardia concava]
MRTLRIAFGAAIAATLLSGCTIDGKPLAHNPDLAALDTGRYGVDPLEPPTGTEATGRVLESARMAEALLDPAQIDATLVHSPTGIAVELIPTPSRAAMLLAEPVRPVLQRHGMVAGAMVGGSDIDGGVYGLEVGKGRALVALVIRFPDATAAQQAATEIDAVDTAVNRDNVAVTIPDHPGAHAHWRPTVPTLAATLAQDNYVISLLIGHTTPDLTILTGLARKAFDAQSPLLRDFEPTPEDRLAALPLDPDRMVRLMVPDAPGRWMYPGVVSLTEHRHAGWDTDLISTGVSYGPRATLLYRGPEDKERGPAPEAMVTNGFAIVLRYSDPVAAHRRLEKSRATDAADTTLRPVDPPAGTSDVSCYQNLKPDFTGMSNFICRMQYGRYNSVVLGRDATGASQRAAAQYALLTSGG